MYRKILIGYDGSDASKKAFETACGLAVQHGAELFVLTVARPPDVSDDVETEAVIENSRRYHRRMLAELKPALAAKKINAQLEVGVVDRIEQIIYDPDKERGDRMLAGGRGRCNCGRLR